MNFRIAPGLLRVHRSRQKPTAMRKLLLRFEKARFEQGNRMAGIRLCSRMNEINFRN